MAKAYTNREVDGLRRSSIVTMSQKKAFGVKMKASVKWRKLFEGGICLFQHADDLTQVMWARGDKDLASRAHDSAKEWAKTVREKLHM